MRQEELECAIPDALWRSKEKQEADSAKLQRGQESHLYAANL